MAEDRSARVASRSDPSPFARRLSSLLMRAVVSPTRQRALASVHEWRRRARSAPHEIDYFHEVDDPYSHLAVQAIEPLLRRYNVEIHVHLTRPERGAAIPEPELLAALARRDAAAVASGYAVVFPEDAAPPVPEAVGAAQRALAGLLAERGSPAFAESAAKIGDALWRGDKAVLESAIAALPSAPADEAATAATLERGYTLRARRGHYSGAAFLYAGQWYPGLDRLHHLERRLEALGARRAGAPADGMCFARPEIVRTPVARAAELTLEIFPSLRSPYTAISFEPTLELARATGARAVLRPVLPMVMRGVPVTFAKGRYIMFDAHREAEFLGMPFGRIFDPIGEPVRRAYSLWPWASAQGRGGEYLAAFLRAAFAEGVDTTGDTGLRQVVERAGLSWSEAQARLGDRAWEDELERNRLALVDEMGQWGVPSFRLRGPAGEPDLCVWGQDRLWLVAREIQRRGA